MPKWWESIPADSLYFWHLLHLNLGLVLMAVELLTRAEFNFSVVTIQTMGPLVCNMIYYIMASLGHLYNRRFALPFVYFILFITKQRLTSASNRRGVQRSLSDTENLSREPSRQLPSVGCHGAHRPVTASGGSLAPSIQVDAVSLSHMNKYKR